MRFLLGIGAGVLAGSLALEAGLRLLPVNAGARIAATSDASPYKRYLPHQPYVYSFGWGLDNPRRGVTSAEGFTNSPDFAPQARALVIGDSFIESLMLDYPDTVQGQLDRLLGGRVYAASSSGNGLADALQIVRHFGPRLQPRNLVLFVEPGDLNELLAPADRGHNAFQLRDGALQVAHNPYQESAAKQMLLKSALLRYAMYNLRLPDWVSSTLASARGARPAAPPTAAQRRQVLDAWFDGLRQAAPDSRVVLLVDADRYQIYAGAQAKASIWKDGSRELLIEAARARGVAVADMRPVFAAHWQQQHERLDFLPMDAHWNRVAHRLAAEQLLPLLAGDAR